MEKLHYRSDGAAETPSGLFAVLPVIRSGEFDGVAFFEYKASPISDITRIEWPAHSDVILIDVEVAKELVRAGYAMGLTKNQVDAYNEAVEAWEKDNPDGDESKAPGATEITAQTAKPAASDTLSTINADPAPPGDDGHSQNNLSVVDDKGAPAPENASTATGDAAETSLDAGKTGDDNGAASGAPVIPVKPGAKK